VAIAVPGALLVAASALLGACRLTDEASTATLPPMRTTTSSTTPPTSTVSPEDRFYRIQPGDTLAIIAERYGVSIQSIVTLNALSDPDAIQAGQTIEIPVGGVVPAPTTTLTPPTTSG
jgi:LysM repeat protein